AFDKVALGFGCDPAPRRKQLQVRHGLALAQLREPASGNQLLRLHKELDLSDAATSKLHIVAEHGYLAVPLVRMDLALDRMHIGNRGIVEILTPDIRLQFLQERSEERRVG